MEGTCFVGTCGYDYLDWREIFYPGGLARESFLRYYAGVFGAVEINASFYQMPTAAGLRSMAVRAPELRFALKANDTLTHAVDPAAWPAKAAAFREAAEALRGEGRLAAILFQFPASFHYQAANRSYLDRLLREFEGFPAAVEFRHAEWFNRRVLDALRARGVAWCCTDLPKLPTLPPPADVVTAELGYVRFHGRNEEAFWGSDAAGRYDYLYTPAELSPWAARIRAMADQAGTVLAFFNNHRYGQAARNAKMLQDLLAVAPAGTDHG